MEYRYLKAFLLTAQYGSFSKAAESLRVAQSAVSRQIKLLEETMGQELIVRSSKKVLLTNKGRELFVAVQNFDKSAMAIFEKSDNRPVNIGVLHGLLETWLTPILAKYYKKYTRNITIHVDTPGNLKKAIGEGVFDIVFTTENIQSELISSLNLFDEHLILISKKEINVKKLHEYPWVVYNENDNLFKISKKSGSPVIMVDSITTIVNLVRNNTGIAVVPDHVLKKGDNIFTYEVPELPKSEIFMVTLNFKVMPAHIQEIVSIIKEEGAS